ncbi:MAG: hypothetical protein KGD63_05030 [Candidatus Lokiarchaeota archaeon]|nr:hypothetical protein [Candidatus Lokiarchaeota archaeon]
MSQKTATIGLLFGLIGMGLAGYLIIDSKILPMLDPSSEESIKNTWYC